MDPDIGYNRVLPGSNETNTADFMDDKWRQEGTRSRFFREYRAAIMQNVRSGYQEESG
jgi:hypothetical protein